MAEEIVHGTIDDELQNTTFLDDPLSSVAMSTVEHLENDLNDFVPGTPLDEFGLDRDGVPIDNEQPDSGDINDCDLTYTNSASPESTIVEPKSNTEHENPTESSVLREKECTHPHLAQSSAATRLLGKRKPQNTMNNSRTGMKLLSEFAINMVKTDERLAHLKDYCTARSTCIVPFANEVEQIFMQLPLCDRSPALGFDVASLMRLRFFCIEFVACYRSKRLQDTVSPNAMLAYLRGAQRRLRELGMTVTLFSGPIFADPNSGLVAVLDNKFSEQQAGGRTMRPHNVLCVEDVALILDSEHCNPLNADGYRNRLLFIVGLSIGARTSELHMLKCTQFKRDKVDGNDVLVYHPVIGSTLGTSKNRRGGIRAAKEVPQRIPIFNASLCGGRLNAYAFITQYLQHRADAGISSDRFFLGTRKAKKVHPTTFFKDQPIGRNTFTKLVRDICNELGVRGVGLSDAMSTHGLRSTMITLLMTAGFSDAAVALRTGHRDLNSLKSYHNLLNDSGRKQLEAVFQSPSKKTKSTLPESHANHSRDPINVTSEPALHSNEEAVSARLFDSSIPSGGAHQFAGFHAQSCTVNIRIDNNYHK